MYPSISCLLCHSHFILLCIVSHSVSSIKFDMLHVYKQLYTCLYTHLNKYNQLVIVIFYLYSDCLIHLCIIMYLLCIHHISSHIVYQKYINHTLIYIINHTLIYIINTHGYYHQLVTPVTLYNLLFIYIFPLYSDKLGILISKKKCHLNYWSFINSKHLL